VVRVSFPSDAWLDGQRPSGAAVTAHLSDSRDHAYPSVAASWRGAMAASALNTWGASTTLNGRGRISMLALSDAFAGFFRFRVDGGAWRYVHAPTTSASYYLLGIPPAESELTGAAGTIAFRENPSLPLPCDITFRSSFEVQHKPTASGPSTPTLTVLAQVTP
jgi:hypothetical protein